jgi:hypothetical protein
MAEALTTKGARIYAAVPASQSWRLIALALVPPIAALLVQSLLWRWVNPFVWFLFYPAAFFSSWIGGKWGGILGTLLSERVCKFE